MILKNGMMTRIWNTNSGFTLPELLMTAAILAYCISIVLMCFINSTALNQESRNLTAATTHAEYVMESIKNTSFANIATNISGGTWTWNTSAVTSNGLTALNSESITTTSSGANPLDVSVTVTWNDMQGRSRSKVLRTLFSG
jgi:prepilin-type N-terminal cleavage/methylation domain-containing protein